MRVESNVSSMKTPVADIPAGDVFIHAGLAHTKLKSSVSGFWGVSETGGLNISREKDPTGNTRVLHCPDAVLYTEDPE